MGLSVGLLVVISVVVVSAMAFSRPALMERCILIPSRVAKHREYHRLLTAGWVHGDGAHLLFNMLSLYFFAGVAEHALGPLAFIALYVSAVVVGFIPTVVRHRNESKYRSLGASGAVSAIIFSAILVNPGISMYLMFVPIPIPGWLFAIAYLAYSAYSSRRGRGNINHDAHFTGACYGIVMTALLVPERVQLGLQQFFA